MKKNISTQFNKEHCCGCSACLAICGKNAIIFHKDEQGFYYPQVNEELCVECGLCVDVCPDSHPIINLLSKCYAAKRKDTKKAYTSTSGGFAASLSEHIVKRGGVVYGVCYGPFPKVVNRRASTFEELEDFKGSKYVQSHSQNTFSEVAEDLKAGLEVAYFATSCTVNGLLCFLQKRKINTERLITIDLICHGVPSPGVFEEYIGWLSRKQRVNNFLFRTKLSGWGGGSNCFHPTIQYDSGNEFDTPRSLAFQTLFFSNNCLRPFCYRCPYAGHGRAGDLTIADYWRVEQVHPDFFDKAGVSLVFVNTGKGQHSFSSLTDMDTLESNVKFASYGQSNMRQPSPKSMSYEQFWNDYTDHGIGYILKHYAYLDNWTLLKRFIKKRLLHR